MQQNMHLEIKANAKDLAELNKEIGELKLVIGFMLMKLPPESRQNVINELKDWGVPDAAKTFDQFVNIVPLNGKNCSQRPGSRTLSAVCQLASLNP